MSDSEAFPRRPLSLRRADTSRDDGTYIVVRRVSFPTDPGYEEDYTYAVSRHRSGAEPLRYATDEEIVREVARRADGDRATA